MLVSTSVIEVGVDVPAATVCIVEHAELFGLSQLHQLRGRIGRGAGDGDGGQRECYCVLTYDDQSPGREKALRRLMTLKVGGLGVRICFVLCCGGCLGVEPRLKSNHPRTVTHHSNTNANNPNQRTTDGFEIAEQDLRLRGPGEITGSRQSGHKGFRLVDLVVRALY